jgi:hypothetical protein
MHHCNMNKQITQAHPSGASPTALLTEHCEAALQEGTEGILYSFVHCSISSACLCQVLAMSIRIDCTLEFGARSAICRHSGGTFHALDGCDHGCTDEHMGLQSVPS